jgi:hypothetical protein
LLLLQVLQSLRFAGFDMSECTAVSWSNLVMGAMGAAKILSYSLEMANTKNGAMNRLFKDNPTRRPDH